MSNKWTFVNFKSRGNPGFRIITEQPVSLELDDNIPVLDPMVSYRIYMSGMITEDIRQGRDWKKKFLKYQELLQRMYPQASFFNSASEVAGYDMIPDHWVKDLEKWQYRTVMTRDLNELCKCDIIAFMPDWRKSNGAKCEKEVAKCLGIKQIYLPEMII